MIPKFLKTHKKTCNLLPEQIVSYEILCALSYTITTFEGGSVAEWLGRQSCNPEVSGLSPTLTTG